VSFPVASRRARVWAASRLMQLFPRRPKVDDFALREVFNQQRFREASRAGQDDFKIKSAQYRYDYEGQRPFFTTYFPGIDMSKYAGKEVLDVGCFTGGRLVSWAERYALRRADGIDINWVFVDAARRFARLKEAPAHFVASVGEHLPYRAGTFDVVTSYDVLEHVQDVERVMAECWRVLRPGGELFVVFPPFFQPLESHLGMVTALPALHWFFDGDVLATAAHDVARARGEEASWYGLKSRWLAPWERAPSLNGITVGRFRQIVSEQSWDVVYWASRPLFSDGRRSRLPLFRLLRHLFAIPARLPLLEEVCLGRVCCVLAKRRVEECGDEESHLETRAREHSIR